MNALVEYTTTFRHYSYSFSKVCGSLSALDTIQALISAILGNGVTSLGAKRAAVVRHSLLHHGLSLITHIFSLDGAEFDAEMLIPIISQLLHAMAPVLQREAIIHRVVVCQDRIIPPHSHYSFIPQVGPKNDQFRSTLQFEDPVHICLRIIGSFPIDDQMMCLSGMMNLVCDPEKHIAQELQREGVLVNENDVSVKLCRKLIKTGKIANRQEPLLNLITLAVKSDNFLEPFVELQHNSAKNTEAALNSEGKKKNLKELRNDKEETEEDAQQRKTGGELMTLKGHQRWSELLVSCLNLYSHYHNLNSQVEDNTYISSVSVGDDPVWDPEDIPSEDKAFTILLELLAGNCLACLLAAINEPTFVDCQLKLLKSPNTSLQRKGIETLMDRLHQSLPTTENQMTEEVAATKAENLKDPKVKLHPAQLFELRARPLTTKRSVVLLPHIMAILKRELLIVGETLNKKEKSSLLKESTSFIQLCASSIEELVRIIGGGGSNKAERELLRIQRIGDISGKGASAAAGFMMTEAVVAKLFGSKASVSLIHNYVNDLLDLLKALQAPLIQASSSSVGVAMRSQGCILAITSITAVSTVIRTLGVAFSTPHANRVFSTISIWMEAIMTISASGANEVEGQGLLRRVLLLSVIHMLPNTWTMIHPYVATFLSFATHNVNAYDGETTQEASDLLILLKGVLGHRSVLECICSALSPGATQEQGVFSARRITPHTHNLRIVYHFVNMMLTEMTKDEIESMPVLISNNRSTNFWISSFASLASTTGSAAAANEIPSIESMEPIFEAYCTFFVKFREKKCLKLLSQILEWVMSSSSFSTGGAGAIQRNKRHRVEDNKDTINEEEEDTEDIPEELYQEDGYTKHQLHQQLVFLSFYCYILKKMKGVIDFTFPLVCPLLVELLGRYNPTPFTLLSETGAEPVGSWVLRRKVLLSRVMYANQSLLNAVRLMSEESTPEADISAALAADRVFFARKDTYNAVMPLLVAQLSNISVLRGSSADYGGDMSILERAQRTIIPSLRTFFNCLSSPNLWSQTQKEILKMLRHPHFEVRKATLQTLQYIYRDGGDQLCALIVAEALPGIVEMTEDANRAVMEQARSLCNELSAITGQDVLHAMS